MRRSRALLVTLAVLSGTSPSATAQVDVAPAGGTVVDEARALGEAAALEARRDLAGAERVLRGLLLTQPTSVDAMLALHRVLRARGQARAILPVADAVLALDPRRTEARALKLRVLAEVDSLAELRAEAERWLAADAGTEGIRGALGSLRPALPGVVGDNLAVAVAGALLDRGALEDAASALQGVEGARATLQRGYVRLAAGDIEGGRQELLAAAPLLSPSSGTDAIQLAVLLGSLSPEGAELIVRAAVLAHGGKGEAAAKLVGGSAAGLPDADRAPVLAEGARMAERAGLDPLAAELRQRILADHSDTDEVAEASLALARYRARTAEGRAEAIRILEDLVTRRPGSAVVPDARRELERLRGRG